MDTSQFIVNTLLRDVNNIFEAQRLIVERGKTLKGKDLKVVSANGTNVNRDGYARKGRTGRLLNSLNHPEYFAFGDNGKFAVTSKILTYMRFLDIRYIQDWHIYNRQVWGILYNHAYPDIRYQVFTNVVDTVGLALKKAFQENG